MCKVPTNYSNVVVGMSVDLGSELTVSLVQIFLVSKHVVIIKHSLYIRS
jgi:hypothetical protein